MTAQFTPIAEHGAPIAWQPPPVAAQRSRLACDGAASRAVGSSAHKPIDLQLAFSRLAAGNDAAARDIRAAIAARRAVLCASLAGGVDSLPTRRTASQLADEVVVGAFRVAHARLGGQARSMRLPLTLVATGAYGRRILSPLERPTLAILADDCEDAGPLIDTALEILALLGFPVDYAELRAAGEPRAGSRVLWGRGHRAGSSRRAF